MRRTRKNRFFIVLLSLLCGFPSGNNGAIPLILAPAPIVIPPIIVTVTKAALVTSTAAGLVFSFFFKNKNLNRVHVKTVPEKQLIPAVVAIVVVAVILLADAHVTAVATEIFKITKTITSNSKIFSKI